MQTLDELKYSQSVWGFQPRKSEIREVCDVKGLLRHRNHLDVSKDRFKQRCQIVPLVRKTIKCPDCGTEIMLASCGRPRYVQGLPNGKLLTFFRLSVHPGESGARPRLGWWFLLEDGGFLRVRDCDVGE